MNTGICYTAVVKRQPQFLFEVNMSSTAPSGQLSDETLIARASRGDQTALEALYDRHAGTVLGIALRITGERTSAEDVLQETFWRAWHGAVTFQSGRGSFTAWLFRIARNAAIDLHRRERVRPPEFIGTASDQAFLEHTPDPNCDVPAQAQSMLKAQQVRNALEILPLEQRQVIAMAFFYGMTRKEIAAATGDALGTIHTRARLGLQKLRDELEFRPEFEGYEYHFQP